MSSHNGPSGSTITLVSLAIMIVLVGLIAGLCAGIPQYRVYNQQKTGEAEFKQAEQNRRIAVEEARAELESADLKRQADVIRAEGIAEANRIIGASITPEYIQWRWVEGLHDGTGETIYIPTESNLPILEAMRIRPTPVAEDSE